MGMVGIVAGSRLSDGDEAVAARCRLFLHPRSHRKHEGLDQMRNLVGKAPRAECVATQREVASGAYRERFAAFAKALEPVPVE